MGTEMRIGSAPARTDFDGIKSNREFDLKHNAEQPASENGLSARTQHALQSMTLHFVGESVTERASRQTGVAHAQKLNQAPEVATPPPTTPPLPAAPPPPPAPAHHKKGLFGRIWDGVKDAAHAVGNAVSTAAHHVGDALHTVGSGIVNGVVGAVKNVGEGLGNVFSGIGKMLDIRPLGKIFSGDFAGAFRDYGKNFLGGLGKIGKGIFKATVQTAADALIVGVVSGLSAIQSLVGAEPLGRKLNEQEIAELRKVYGDSIDYSKVRVKEGKAGSLSVFSQGGDRPFTLGNTIYMKDDKSINTLVHEMAHVWQHQHGGTDYLSEALVAQFIGDGYDFEKALKEGKSWSEMNPEQQAEMIQTAHQQGFFNDPNARFVVDGVDYTAQLRDALNQIKNGRGAP